MEVFCTRPGCPRPQNYFTDLDDAATLRTVQQKFCTTCGMPLLLVGRYLPTRLLGQGGFGAAFLARDRYTPAMRQCVVKQFQPAGDLTPAQLQVAQNLFEREAQVLEELGNNHPQIPDLLAFFELDAASRIPGKTDRFFYLAQEFIDGINLEDELAQKGTLTETEVLEVLKEILKVLKYVHDHNSIHRDIKPSNIMRRRDGRLFLLDFGAVKQVTTGAASAGSKGSTGIYSMGFAPPEQMRGDVVYPATDLYALAVTCITLLTGKQPNELYDPYSNHWDWRSHTQVSDRLATVLDKMLLATPSQRYQSASEVAAALRGSTTSASATPTPPVPVMPPPPVPSRGASAVTSPPPAPASATAMQASTPAPVTPTPAAQPPAPQPSQPFSLMEFLGGAAFTGFEGGLLAIALLSLLGTLLGTGFWLLLLVGLLLAQWRRWIERWDLVVIGAVTLLLVLFVPFLNKVVAAQVTGNSFFLIIILAILTGLAAVVVAIVFRLVYLIISRFV